MTLTADATSLVVEACFTIFLNFNLTATLSLVVANTVCSDSSNVPSAIFSSTENPVAAGDGRGLRRLKVFTFFKSSKVRPRLGCEATFLVFSSTLISRYGVRSLLGAGAILGGITGLVLLDEDCFEVELMGVLVACCELGRMWVRGLAATSTGNSVSLSESSLGKTVMISSMATSSSLSLSTAPARLRFTSLPFKSDRVECLCICVQINQRSSNRTKENSFTNGIIIPICEKYIH